MLQHLLDRNDFKVYSITDNRFKRYGKVLSNNIESISQHMKNHSIMPAVGNIYVPSSSEMESMEIYKEFKNNVFGGMDIQIGYCNGNTHSLSALEYHKCPEVNIAITPLVLFLARSEDINNNILSSDVVEAFYLEENTIVELYSNTMHFAPCSVQEEGFKCVVVLTLGTNDELVENIAISEEDKLLFKKNKWLIAHKEREDLIEKGAREGIVGINYVLNY